VCVRPILAVWVCPILAAELKTWSCLAKQLLF